MPLSRPLPRGPNALLSSAVSQDPGRASHTQGSPRRRGPACRSHSLPPPPCPLALARDRPLPECHVAALITNPHRGRSWRGGTPGHVTTSVEDAPAPPAALAPRVAPGSQTLRRAMALSAIQESRPRLVLPSPVQLPHFPSLISNAQKKLQIVILWSI